MCLYRKFQHANSDLINFTTRFFVLCSVKNWHTARDQMYVATT